MQLRSGRIEEPQRERDVKTENNNKETLHN